MELNILDPYGDYQTAGYLRNHFKEKDLEIVAHLEAAAFYDHVTEAIRLLRKHAVITYAHVLQTHKCLFESVYPWAGEDRSVNAPDIAIVRAGYNKLFTHPQDIRRATDYALHRASDSHDLREHPGEIFGYFAHAHPFLEGNGRTILTVFTELCRRSGFYVRWDQIAKKIFLETLTDELQHPGSGMDGLVKTYMHDGKPTISQLTAQMNTNFHR